VKTGFAILLLGLVFGVGAMVLVLHHESDPQVAKDRQRTDANGYAIDPGRQDADAAAVVAAGRRAQGEQDTVPRPTPKGDGSVVAGDPATGTGSVIAAMAAMPGNRVRLGELETGVIRTLDGPAVGHVAVSTGDQRGLLGLAVDENGTTYAAYTQRGGARRLVVDKVGVGAVRRVWTGPPSARDGNGGHIALAPDGRLVIGVGALGHPELIDRPDVPNGKLLSLSLDGPATQTPRVLSSGWNDPYAFTFTPDGTLWVADDAAGRTPERLGRGDGKGPRTPLGRPTGPSGLAAIDDHTLAVCGVANQRLDRYTIDGDGRTHFAGTISNGCTFGVVRRGDGTLLVSTASGLVTVRP
jgi:hypothetical protein